MKRIFKSVKDVGVLETMYKIFTAIKFHSVRRYHEIFIFRFKSRKQVFDSIYKNNYWGSDDSISGPGSSLLYTENIRANLPVLFKMFRIKNVFDAPCGDYNWLSKTISELKIDYIGADIVKEIIIKNKKEYKKDNVDFIEMDITEDNFPQSDLWLCRDCLFHLSYNDISKSLDNFIKSDIPYILTTTHKNADITNKDILTGDFRLINLFSYPFLFPKDCLYRFDDYLAPEPEREMCLWSRDQIISVINDVRKNIGA